MGRPEPYVLFAHSFVHAQLDEYVDEVLFGEPVVVTGCEFLEQNVSPPNPAVSLVGATSPPSFALEIFVHCEGESRFRRLCQPFLYSPSSSNMLEIEAVVTNHLLVRGSYRSLTFVVYGNTAEDLGQFNIDVELDSSLANLVYSSSEGKLEDLPPALRSTNLPLEESISSLKSLSLPVPLSDPSCEMREFLHLTFKNCQIFDHLNTSLSAVVAVVSSYISSDFGPAIITCEHNFCNIVDSKKYSPHAFSAILEATDKLRELYNCHQPSLGSESTDLFENEMHEPKELANPQFLVHLFNQHFALLEKETAGKDLSFRQNRNMVLRLGVILLLCSARECCFWFVKSGGMKHISHIFSCDLQRSAATTLLLLCVVEQATRYAIGCEGFLGWWPCEDGNVPLGNSDGYCHLLSLLMQKQRHDIASLATYILHRLRSYEIAARYESAVLSLLTDFSADCLATTDRLHVLVTANSLLKNILKLLNLRGAIEEPFPMVSAKSSALGQADGPLSYKATVDFITSSKCSFFVWDIDTHLLSLLKERGFLPLSAALLSSSVLRSAGDSLMEMFMDIAASIELILLSLLCCRSGLTFLLFQPEATTTLIISLQGIDDSFKAGRLTLRHAAVLISKGFFCRPQEIGMIAELHLRVGNTIDRLLSAPPNSEEQLWVLWELCAISRSDSGRQALLAVGQYPEAVAVLIQALRSFKNSETIVVNSGSSPLSLAIFHFAAEIIEVLIMDSNATSLASWIGLAANLHKALHSSSPGFNRKDAPTRVLEWIDAGVVYHRNGVIGLLRYAAVLASGGDAHFSSGSVLVSDSMDIENVLGDSSSASDSLVVDNLLGKLVSDKYFGAPLHSTSVVQLTTAFRILSFVSENSTVAASLYEEGAITVIYVVLVNCRFMLERSSNTFDYLVEGAECSSSSDLLLERNLEQSIVELMIPSLVLLINLLQKLNEAKEQYRNTKLLKALLRLHRELSPKLAACTTDSSFHYHVSALDLCTICRLLVSALACWPIYGWTPGLFHCLLESVQASSSLALGPKDACSVLYLLGDLFPEEGVWLWKNGMPLLSAVRTLSVGTILGPEAEKNVDWHLQQENLKVLLGRLTPQLDKISQIVLHFAFTALVVVQDMLRVFIIRIACQKSECAVVLLQPIILWFDDHIKGTSNLSEMDFFKVHRLLEFTSSLLEHPCAKTLLLKMGILKVMIKILERCYDACMLADRLVPESKASAKSADNVLGLCVPAFTSLALIFYFCQTELGSSLLDEFSIAKVSTKDSSRTVVLLLKLCEVLPVGKELLACLNTFKEIASCRQGRSALLAVFPQIQSSSIEIEEHAVKENGDTFPDFSYWKSTSPFLVCWRKLLGVLHLKDNASVYAIEAAYLLSSGGLCLSMEGKSLEGIVTLKCLFGLPYGVDGGNGIVYEELWKHLHEMVSLLDQWNNEDEVFISSTRSNALCQVKDSVKSMILLLKKSDSSSVKAEDNIFSGGSAFEDVSSVTPSLHPNSSVARTSEFVETSSPFSHVLRSSGDSEQFTFGNSLGGLADRFIWECPDTAPDRLVMSSGSTKRRLASSEGSNRRSRDNVIPETVGTNVFPRGVGGTSSSTGPTRRDTFRQRKPNTSRPPSMHVDDYVARERNTEGIGGGTNVLASQRGGMTSGRPPSIHVDEFMARQRERQNPMAVVAGDAVQIKTLPLMNCNEAEKSDKSQKLKADLDDDLQEIDIVFDDESESDDRLPFPQPDDNLQPPPVIAGGSSPGSIVEENESDVNENAQFSQVSTLPPSENGDPNLKVPLRRRASKAEMLSASEKHAPSEKNRSRHAKEKSFFEEQSAESKYVAPTQKGFDNLPPANINTSHFYNASPAQSSLHSFGDSVFPTMPSYPRDSSQKASNVSSASAQLGYHEQKAPIGQPPLPPMPPPVFSSVPLQTSQPVPSHSSPYVHPVRETPPPLPLGSPLVAFDVSVPGSVPNFQIYSERLSSVAGHSMPSTSSQAVLDSRYSWVSVSASSKLNVEAYTSNSSTRPLPPLPTTPPPFSSPLITQSSAIHSGSQSSVYSLAAQLSSPSTSGIFSTSVSSLATFSLPSFAQWQASLPGTLFSSVSQPIQNLQAMAQTNPSPQPSLQSLQPRPPPLPPPPQAPRPPNPQKSRPAMQPSEQVVSLQSPIQVQVQPLQVQQQLQIPQIVYYQPQQQENLLHPPQPSLEQPQSQKLPPPADNKVQQQDSGMLLQQYFSSPEAIQSLLSDRDKLCQLLEQHPKLMQMLQERLGQL